MEDYRVKDLRVDQEQRRVLLARKQEQAAESAHIPVDESSLGLVRVKLLLVGHRVGELIHDHSLKLLVPPGFKRAIGRVQVAGPLVLSLIDLKRLVQEEGAQE